jgi:hypothetical protein
MATPRDFERRSSVWTEFVRESLLILNAFNGTIYLIFLVFCAVAFLMFFQSTPGIFPVILLGISLVLGTASFKRSKSRSINLFLSLFLSLLHASVHPLFLGICSLAYKHVYSSLPGIYPVVMLTLSIVLGIGFAISRDGYDDLLSISNKAWVSSAWIAKSTPWSPDLAIRREQTHVKWEILDLFLGLFARFIPVVGLITCALAYKFVFYEPPLLILFWMSLFCMVYLSFAGIPLTKEWRNINFYQIMTSLLVATVVQIAVNFVVKYLGSL